jgi:ABC-type molybdenum transport system ATPase subunit/photorepair protein PhrA
MNTKTHHHLCAVKENGRMIERVVAQEKVDQLVTELSQSQERFALFVDGLCRLPGQLSADQIQQRETRLRLARVTTLPREAA